ncbi:MAG: hypothetical protein Tp136SUR676911_36 [Prokaryotic dsDNA virus sp.]|jgi:hypothetical protein|nr:MAG: hypothetical protein Tp136SUR676911_36 [Prokaryotic dsDNA virus sp.]|tara:strand:- start:23817 stop:24380 length:564 start_codon:yes stop_codon:yes gene_type:complete
MPLLPEEYGIESARVQNNSPVTTSESQSLIYLQRKTPSQRWDISLRSTLLTPDDADAVWGFMAAREQDLQLIDVRLPRYSYSDATDKTTSTTGAIGDTNITTTGSVADVKVGKFFQFGGHSKVYVVTSVGGGNFDFAPALRRTVTSGETITFNDVTWSCKLRGRPLEFNASADTDSVRIDLDLVEAL